MVKGKRIFITGGNGFLGSALANRLAEDNVVSTLDVSFPSANTHPNIKKIIADVTDRDSLVRYMRGAQIIIHTAAKLGVQEILNDAVGTLNTNYIGTSNVLQVAVNSPSCERVISFSSSEVFGVQALNVAENGDSLLRSVQDPRWCYFASKLAAEHLAFGYYRQFELPVTVVRPFNIFGAGRMGNHAVVTFARQALTGRNLEVDGSGDQIRAWCYVDDFCDAVLRILEADSTIGKAFNIGNPANAVSVFHLAKMIKYICLSHSEIVFKPALFTDIDVRIPDITLAKTVLGFTPRISLEEGLQRTIEWIRENDEEVKLLEHGRAG